MSTMSQPGEANTSLSSQVVMLGGAMGEEEEAEDGGGQGGIKGNTVYIWFWLLLPSTDRCLSVYDVMKTAFQAGGSCSQGRV